ncbi:MAG: hypothetical protein QHC79_04135 [Pseudosphingobacterium sp.]|nr:hypothetical protein [Olivibacter sp. UJ_SKK_5.1]MDX3912703.1 hypothetical protein [Pseudosphingobacterium sp.]
METPPTTANVLFEFLKKYGLITVIFTLVPSIATTLFMMSEAGKFLYYGIPPHYMTFNYGDFLQIAPVAIVSYFLGLLLLTTVIYIVSYLFNFIKTVSNNILSLLLIFMAYGLPYLIGVIIFKLRSETEVLPFKELIFPLLGIVLFIEFILLLFTFLENMEARKLLLRLKANSYFHINPFIAAVHYILVSVVYLIIGLCITYTYGYNQAKKNNEFYTIDNRKTLIVWHNQQKAITIDTAIKASRSFQVLDISKIDTLHFKTVKSDINKHRNK